MSTGKSLSVFLTATCDASSVTLHFGAPGSYRIWKKLPDDKSWGNSIWERPIGTEFVDAKVTPGQALEYRVIEMNTGACAYVMAGFQVPPVTQRGKLILIVEQTHAGALANELTRFENDLKADGYSVLRRACSRNDSPESVKTTIKEAFLLDPDHTNTLILLGSVPVFQSGPYSYDGHSPEMVASDGFFSDMSTADWSGKPSIFPAKLRLATGRIDFSTLVCFSNKPNNPRSEVDLLRQYLSRNHRFRNGQWNVTRRAAIRDGFSDRDFSSNGWRNFPQMVGDKIDEIPDGQFFSTLAAKDYLICFAAGGGQKTSMAGTGGTTSGSDDFALNSIQCPFVMLLGSAFLGQWNSESGFLRSALASGNDERGCLVAFGAGAPNVFLHWWAAGGTIGESFLLSQNNFYEYAASGAIEDGLYSPANSTGIPQCAARVHQSLHGDPTLTMFPKRNTSLRILDVLASVDGGATWRVVDSTELDVTGMPAAIFRLAIR